MGWRKGPPVGRLPMPRALHRTAVRGELLEHCPNIQDTKPPYLPQVRLPLWARVPEVQPGIRLQWNRRDNTCRWQTDSTDVENLEVLRGVRSVRLTETPRRTGCSPQSYTHQGRSGLQPEHTGTPQSITQTQQLHAVRSRSHVPNASRFTGRIGH